MAITKQDILFEYVLGVICAVCFLIFHKHWVAQRIYSYLKWIFPVVMLVPVLPDSFCPKEIKLITAWGFGFDLFMLTENGRDPTANIYDTLFTVVCKLPHHLTVLCSDSYIEIIGYSVCWAVHAFAYQSYIGQGGMIQIWKYGNHVPILVVTSYCFRYFILGENGEAFFISFAVAIQMLFYRYVFITCVYQPYWPFNTPVVYRMIKNVTKPILTMLAVGFLLFAVLW